MSMPTTCALGTEKKKSLGASTATTTEILATVSGESSLKFGEDASRECFLRGSLFFNDIRKFGFFPWAFISCEGNSAES